MERRIPNDALVVLVGPAGSGKSTWAAMHARPEQVVSSDALRGVVGVHPTDQKASKDAFAVLDQIVAARLKRGLFTIIDATSLQADTREGWRQLANDAGRACHAVVFDTPAAECRKRNKARDRPVPARVLTGQIQALESVLEVIDDEGFDDVHRHDDGVRVVPRAFVGAPAGAARQQEEPMTLSFGLQIPSYTWEGGPEQIGPTLARLGREAEEAGFTSIWVMDHFLQIPQVGPAWHDMLDSWTTLAFLANATSSIRLGTLVTGVTYRNVAHLGKIVATLDVLSGGRAICGLGAAWFDREHEAYGWEFPPLAERYALLEDALNALPVLWGPGSKPFDGSRISIPDTTCYPRPLQERVPILVGGSGERKTLRLVAQYADACNLFGDPATIAHKVDVLHGHCADLGRDPDEIEVTQLLTVLAGESDDDVAATAARLAPDNLSPEQYATRVNAGIVDDLVGRFREYAEAGVDSALVNMPNVAEPGALARFAPVIDAFGRR